MRLVGVTVRNAQILSEATVDLLILRSPKSTVNYGQDHELLQTRDSEDADITA